ncbi:hypothetical protein D3C73_1591380 [compost metagenome]
MLLGGDRIVHLVPAAIGFHVVEIIVQDRTGRFLERIDKGPLHFSLGFVVILFAGNGNQVQQPLTLLPGD